jgi:hypothetical protein
MRAAPVPLPRSLAAVSFVAALGAYIALLFSPRAALNTLRFGFVVLWYSSMEALPGCRFPWQGVAGRRVQYGRFHPNFNGGLSGPHLIRQRIARRDALLTTTARLIFELWRDES